MIKFGTDGWRALIAKDYTFQNVGKVIQAYADVLKDQNKKGKIYVGFDCRFLSEDFAKYTSDILTTNGFEVYLSTSFCPTPCVSWMCNEFKAIGGVMITASHNPYQWNGIKFKEGYGGSASPEFCNLVEEKIVENDQKNREIVISDQTYQYFDPLKEYVDALKKFVDLDLIKKSKFKIGYDALYGSGQGFLTKILAGKEIFEHHHELNPNFDGLNPEPIAKNLKTFSQLIKDKKLDIGVATDGDADRIGAMNEKGEFIDSHHIFALLLKHLVENKNKKGLVVKTLSTTNMLNKQCEKYGLELVETGVGFKHIAKKFLEKTPLIGGEESGGIAVADHVYERDGVLCALLLLEIMAIKNKPISEIIHDLHQEFGEYYFQREDLHLTDSDKKSWIDFLENTELNSIDSIKVVGHQTTDGHKYLLEDESWVLVRFSGTEPVMRVYVESSSEEKVNEILASFLKIKS